MILPISIPAWIQIKGNAKKYGLDITVNIDPVQGRHTGHFFYKKKTYTFRIEMYPKNMIISMKEYNKEVFDIWSKSMESSYRVLYQANTEFPFHGEWYFECEEEAIQGELRRLQNSPNIKILAI